MIFNYKPTKDAKTLEGHGAEYFTALEDFEFGKISNKVKYYSPDSVNCNDLVVGVALGRASNASFNFPTIEEFWYIVTLNYGGYSLKQIAISYTDNSKFYVRTCNGGNWSEWENPLANYLPLTGGTVNGNIEQTITTADYIKRYLANSARKIIEQVGSNGVYLLYDDTNSKNIIQSTANGTTVFNGTATENVEKNNGTVSNFHIGLHGSIGYAGFAFRKNGVNQQYIGYNPDVDALIRWSADFQSKTLLDTGNSAKVHIGTSAPSDTSALWIDTSA